MPPIRVLVIDDAVVIRKILTDVISSDPELEVVGTAANGKIGLQKIPMVNPDVVTLDFEMPEMNGIEALRHIRKLYPSLPVIMFSTLTQSGAAATLEALSCGASDFVAKPANVGSVTNSQESVKRELIQKIKALAPKLKKPYQPEDRSTSSLSTLIAKQSRQVAIGLRTDVLAIGVSTGGPNALAYIIPKLPKDLGVPVVIVQHMPPMFTQFLAERLDAQSQLKVIEAKAGLQLEAGTVYIAPGDYHLALERLPTGVFTQLHQGPQENSCRPAVDVLFRSVVEAYGRNVLGVILTGMGQDGLRGCALIKELGGQVLAQDKTSSVVWGMPGYVAEAGLADLVIPLTNMPQEITRICNNSASTGSSEKCSANKEGAI